MQQNEFYRISRLYAGEELDALIAEHIMGLSKCDRFICLPEHGCRCPIHGKSVEWPHRGVHWAPTSDDAACRTVTHQVESRGLQQPWTEELCRLLFSCDLAKLQPNWWHHWNFARASPFNKSKAALIAVLRPSVTSEAAT